MSTPAVLTSKQEMKRGLIAAIPIMISFIPFSLVLGAKSMINKGIRCLLDCVPLVAVIALVFATTHIANLLALIITLLLACRYPLLPTVIISIAVTALLRHYIPY